MVVLKKITANYRKILFVLFTFMSISLVTYGAYRYVDSVGVTAVNSMYDFYNIEELQSNMSILRSVTTEPVYEALTVDNVTRSLFTYMKFKGAPTTVRIKQHGVGYVVYSIDNDYVDSTKVFIFTYKFSFTNWKISYFDEWECVNFNDLY